MKTQNSQSTKRQEKDKENVVDRFLTILWRKEVDVRFHNK